MHALLGLPDQHCFWMNLSCISLCKSSSCSRSFTRVLSDLARILIDSTTTVNLKIDAQAGAQQTFHFPHLMPVMKSQTCIVQCLRDVHCSLRLVSKLWRQRSQKFRGRDVMVSVRYTGTQLVSRLTFCSVWALGMRTSSAVSCSV